jgi:hypothetical protein
LNLAVVDVRVKLARLASTRKLTAEDKFIKYQWLHSEKNEYFEFRIEKTEISNQTVLIIKDFAEKNEIKDQSQLWEYQVKELFHRLGA